MNNRGRSRSARRASKRSFTGGVITAGVIAGLTSVPALAGPQGERVVSGRAKFHRQGDHTRIRTSHQAIINYESFDLNASESVRFVQPNQNSRVLNRITGVMPTVIDGSVTANGGVYFVNPSGITFGPNSVLNVGTLYAAAGNMSNRDFLNNVNRFTDVQGDVINHGSITASREAHMIGRRVANFGSVVTPDGMITMSAGDDVLIGQQGGRVFARIESGSASGGAGGLENHGVIDAGSGQVLAGVGDHFALALYDTSQIRGSSVSLAGGRGSAVRVGGAVDASNNRGRGGEIEVLGGTVALDGATLDASGTSGGGTVHVGGDYQGRGDRLRSKATYVSEGSSIRVDATRSGDAGTAIVWSDGATFFYGDVSAKGAREGGFVEVSGLEYLDFAGTFDLRGPIASGELLLDPTNIWISADDATPGTTPTEADVDNFADVDLDGIRTEILDDTLSGWLTGGASISLKANNDIYFLENAAVAGDGTADLTLQAGRNVVFFANSSLSGVTNFTATVNDTADDFVLADRSNGFGSFITIAGSSIDVSGTLTINVGTGTAGASRPGDIALLGDLAAGTVSLNATETAEGGGLIALVDDGVSATAHIGEGAGFSANAGELLAFIDHDGVWSFDSVSITAPFVSFDAAADGLTGTNGIDINPFGVAGTVDIDTAGGFTFSGATDLGADIIAESAVTFDDAVTLTDGDRSIDAAGLTFGSTLDSAAGEGNGLSVALNGQAAQFTGDAGAGGELGVVEIDGLGAGSSVAFGGSLDAASLRIGSAGDAADTAALGGNTTLTGAGLEIHAGTTTLSGDVTAAGLADFNGAVILEESVTIDAVGLDVELTLDSAAGETNGLAVVLNNGDALFNGDVGAADALGTFTIDGLGAGRQVSFGGTLDAGSVRIGTAGPVSFGTVTFNGETTVADSEVNAQTATVNAAFTTTTGDAVFNSNLNTGALLTSAGGVSVGGSTILGGDIDAAGDGVFTGAVRLVGDRVITANGLTFDGRLDSFTGFTSDLTLNLSAGGAVFNRAVGGLDELGAVMVTGPSGTLEFTSALSAASLTADMGTGEIILGGVATLTDTGTALDLTAGNATIQLHDDLFLSGDALFNTAVDVHNSVTINMLGGASVTFGGTLDSGAGLTEDLVVEMSGGDASFLGVIGGNDPLMLLALNGDAGTVLFDADATLDTLIVGDIGLDTDGCARGGPSPADIVINGAMNADQAIELAYTNSLSFGPGGLLNAPLVTALANGVNLEIAIPDVIGANTDTLNLIASNGADVRLLATGAVADASFIDAVNVLACGDIIFVGNAGGTEWRFNDVGMRAEQSIVFDVNSSSMIFRNGLLDYDGNAGTLAFDAGDDLIVTAAADFTFGGVGNDFVIADDLRTQGNLTVDRDARLADGPRTFTIRNGSTLTFTGTLDSFGAEINDLDVALRHGGSAIFEGDVGLDQQIGDLLLSSGGGTLGLDGLLEFREDLVAESLTSLSGMGTIRLGSGDDANDLNANDRDLIVLTGGNGNIDGANGLERSLELAADNSTIEIHGDLDLALNALFGTNVELHGVNAGEMRTITMNGAGSSLTFADLVLSDAGRGIGLGINLLNSDLGAGLITSAIFEDRVGQDNADGTAGRLGTIRVLGDGASLRFNDNLFARMLEAGVVDGVSDSVLSLVELGAQGYDNPALPWTQSVTNLNGPGNADGYAFDADADDIRINSNTEASNAGIRLAGPVSLRGDLFVTDFDAPAAFDIHIRDGVTTYGTRSIFAVNGDIMIEPGSSAVPVLLRANDVGPEGSTNTELTIASIDGNIFIGGVGGESVQRDGFGYDARFIVSSLSGDLDVHSIGETLFGFPGTPGFLDQIMINLDADGAGGIGTNTLRGNRYHAFEILMHAAQHNLLTDEADVVFGDLFNPLDPGDPANTSLTHHIAITGGPLFEMATGPAFDFIALNALGTDAPLVFGGDVELTAARRTIAGTDLFIRALDHATIGVPGAGDSIGLDTARFDVTEINAFDATIAAPVFAGSLFLNPRNDVLSFNGDEGVPGMVIDRDEVIELNGGRIGTLFLNHNDRATASDFNNRLSAPMTFLFDGTDNGLLPAVALTVGENIEVYGQTFVTGIFESTLKIDDLAPGMLEFFGPTEFRDNSGLNASFAGRSISFFDELAVRSNTSITTMGGDVSFDNGALDPDGAGNSVDGFAEIYGIGNGTPGETFDLTITTNGGNVSLFNVGARAVMGDAQALTSFAVDTTDPGGLIPTHMIDFNGSVYDAVSQAYTADVYNINGAAAPAFFPGSVSFFGNSVRFNDAGLANNQIRLADTVDLFAALSFDPASGNAGRFISDAFVLGTGNQMIDVRVTDAGGMPDGVIAFNRAIGWNGVGDPAAAAPGMFVGSVLLDADDVTVASVLSTGDQLYRNATRINLIGRRYQSGSTDGDAIVFNGDRIVLNPALGTTDIVTGDGGTVFFDTDRVLGRGNSLDVQTGTGTVDFRAGIAVSNAAQRYAGDTYNFFGSATLTSSLPAAAIVFEGGTLQAGGDLAVRTTGAGSDIMLGDLVMLNAPGSELRAYAVGTGSNVLVPMIGGDGTQTARLRADGRVTLGGTQGAGLSELDLDTNLLSITGATEADMVFITTLDPTRDIAVGAPRTGTLNITNADLANLATVGAEPNRLQIGEAGFGGSIFVQNAMLNRDTSLIARGGGTIEFIGNRAVSGQGALSDLDALANQILLGGNMQSVAGPFDLFMSGPVDVTDRSVIRTGGGAVEIVNVINGAGQGVGELDIDTAGGLITLPGTARLDGQGTGESIIGRDRRLASLSLAGSPTLRLAGARTTGDQTYAVAPGGQITLLRASEFDAFEGSTIDVLGPANALGDTTFRVRGNSADNAVNLAADLTGVQNPAQTGLFTVGREGSVSLMGVNGMGVLDVFAGEASLTGDVSVIRDVTLRSSSLLLAGDLVAAGGNSTSVSVAGLDGSSPVASTLSGDLLISADTVSLITNAVAADGGASLTIAGAESTFINGMLGTPDARLDSFTSSEIGLTTLADAGIYTIGRSTFRNAVHVTGDNVVDSSGDTAADGILFESTITGGSSLALIINRETGAGLIGSAATGNLRPDPDSPFIEIRGDIGEFNADGSPVASSLDLFLNYVTGANGNEVIRSNIPINATIVLGNTETFDPGVGLAGQPDINVNVNQLVMGANEKLLGLGNLTLVGSGQDPSARLGDVSAVGNLTIRFPSVSFFQREPGRIFDPSSGQLLPDQGTDVVAGGEIDVQTITSLEGPGAAPEFGQPSGDPRVVSNGFFFLFKFLNVSEGGLGDIVFANGVFIDPRADGVSNTNVAEVIAGAAPREGQSEPVVTDAGLSQAAVDLLNDLQIEIKQPDDATYLVDLPEIAAEGAVKVSSRRLEPDLVSNLLTSYQSTFYVEETGEDGVAGSRFRGDEIQGVLSGAVEAYGQDPDEIDAEGFMNFLRQNPEAQADALNEIERLREIVAGARLLGLTDQELTNVKGALHRDAAPESIDSNLFAQIIEPDQTLLLGVR